MDWDKILRPLDVLGCNLLGRYFVGGESIESVLKTGQDLKAQGFGVTYNLLGEHIRDPKIVYLALASTARLISRMSDKNIGHVSCKPTLYGLEISKDFFQENMGRIVEQACQKAIEIELDAENYNHIQDTFDVFRFFASQRIYLNYVRQAVQAHLKDISSLMSRYDLSDKNLRIVKGSGVYDEKSFSASQDGEEAIRERYFEILKRNTENGRVPFVATVRDRKLAESAIGLAKTNGQRIEFQMLYGPLGRKLGRDLLRLGYPVRIYLPFTDQWCRDEWKPYGLRRAKMIRGIFWREAKRVLLLK